MMLDDSLQERHLSTLAARTADALGASGFDRLVIHSGLEKPAFLDDQAYPFRANPHFLWWAPLTDAPRCLLQVEPGAKPLLLFHAPQDYWHLPPVLPDAPWTRQFDIRPVRDWAATRDALPRPDARTAFIGEPFAGLEDLGFESINPPALLRRLHEHRVRKTPYELACLRVASRLGVRGHRAAHEAWRSGASEYAIHQAFVTASGQRESEQPYAAIVARGSHAATLHYQHLERGAPASPGSLLIDAGAACRGYASDITRSYAAQDGEFAALIAGMEDLQQSLCAAVRPGMDWRDLHLTAHHLVAELLRDAGILRIDPQAAVDTGVSGVFLPHGLGHLLGLQVHDVAGFHPQPDAPPVPPPPGHGALRLTRVLEAGFVVTMEPGLYFIDLLLEQARAGAHAAAIDWQVVDRLRPHGGIRIEDDLVVTDSGHENLTRDAFAAEDRAAQPR
jgi:Xaa-Pro dipeptidase